MFCLILVFNVWPSSVLPSSGIAKFEFWHVLPKSGVGKTSVLPKSVLPSSGAPFFDPLHSLYAFKTYFYHEIHATSLIIYTLFHDPSPSDAYVLYGCSLTPLYLIYQISGRRASVNNLINSCSLRSKYTCLGWKFFYNIWATSNNFVKNNLEL